MPRIVYAFAALALLGCCSTDVHFERWSRLDKAAAATYLAASAIDLGGTIANGTNGCGESDPLTSAAFGSHPSPAQDTIARLTYAAAVLTIADVLPGRWRKAWLVAEIGMEAHGDAHNLTIRCR